MKARSVGQTPKETLGHSHVVKNQGSPKKEETPCVRTAGDSCVVMVTIKQGLGSGRSVLYALWHWVLDRRAGQAPQVRNSLKVSAGFMGCDSNS
jgi:hypothetical protein